MLTLIERPVSSAIYDSFSLVAISGDEIFENLINNIEMDTTIYEEIYSDEWPFYREIIIHE